MRRRYEPSEWVEFLTEPAEPSLATLTLARRFEAAAWALFTRWAEACAVEVADDVTAPRLAFNTLCSIVGHGVGLWDGELLGEAEGRSFEAAVRADAALVRIAHDLDDSMTDDQINMEEA